MWRHRHESRLIFLLPSSRDDILFLTLTGISSDAGIKEELVGTSALQLGDVAADKENEKLLLSPKTVSIALAKSFCRLLTEITKLNLTNRLPPSVGTTNNLRLQCFEMWDVAGNFRSDTDDLLLGPSA